MKSRGDSNGDTTATEESVIARFSIRKPGWTPVIRELSAEAFYDQLFAARSGAEISRRQPPSMTSMASADRIS